MTTMSFVSSIQMPAVERSNTELLVDLHVYMLPLDLWQEHLHSAVHLVANDSISLGFIRSLPETKITDVREEIVNQIGYDNLPPNFVFLRCVGRCFTRLQLKQERTLKVKHFLPPQTYAPELFILEISDNESRCVMSHESIGSARRTSVRFSPNDDGPFPVHKRVPSIRQSAQSDDTGRHRTAKDGWMSDNGLPRNEVTSPTSAHNASEDNENNPDQTTTFFSQRVGQRVRAIIPVTDQATQYPPADNDSNIKDDVVDNENELDDINVTEVVGDAKDKDADAADDDDDQLSSKATQTNFDEVIASTQDKPTTEMTLETVDSNLSEDRSSDLESLLSQQKEHEMRLQREKEIQQQKEDAMRLQREKEEQALKAKEISQAEKKRQEVQRQKEAQEAEHKAAREAERLREANEQKRLNDEKIQKMREQEEIEALRRQEEKRRNDEQMSKFKEEQRKKDEIEKRKQMELTREKEAEKAALLQQVDELQVKRQQDELERAHLLDRVRQLKNKAQARRRSGPGRDAWKKKYFGEKHKTAPLEERCRNMRIELDLLNKKILSQMQTTSQVDPSTSFRRALPSEETNQKIQAVKYQQEIESIRQRIANVSMKITAEIKLRNQVETELRTMKIEKSQRRTRAHHEAGAKSARVTYIGPPDHWAQAKPSQSPV